MSITSDPGAIDLRWVLNPVRMRSNAGSVRRHCESPNEVISPLEKKVRQQGQA